MLAPFVGRAQNTCRHVSCSAEANALTPYFSVAGRTHHRCVFARLLVRNFCTLQRGKLIVFSSLTDIRRLGSCFSGSRDVRGFWILKLILESQCGKI